jgi:hypothetical protein
MCAFGVSGREAMEIDTPNLAFDIRQARDYRIDVNPDDDATT